MKALKLKIGIAALATTLVAGSLIGVHQKREYKYGDYVKEQDAYFVEKIDDPAGLVKAHKFVTPTDDKYSSQKTRSLGTSLIGNIESVWDSYTGAGTTVAIIDDGFDYDHPEYTRQDGTSAILSTSRYYYASGSSAYYQEYSSNPDCIAEDWESNGQGGYEWATHGTNTSTTAAAPMNNGGGVGIAPDADILALKIDFSLVAIRAAIQYAIDQHVDVINMSLGAYAENFTDGWGDTQTGSSSTASYLNNVCQNAYNAGIIVVAAAGNESTWHKSYPACNTKVIGVGALGDWDNKGNATALAEFTNYVGSSQTGEINVDILAPGYVYTATQGGSNSSSHTHTYSDTQGTSFSCPIVAGAACLWKQKYPNGTPDEFLTQLQSTADGIGYYTDKMIPVSGWYEELTDVGPSNITNGRLNVANLLDINEPFVSTVQSNLSISVGEKKQINLDTYNGTITYSSANTSVATVSNTGLVEGVGAGNTTITVTASKNGHTATATVGVNVAPIVAATSLTFNPKTITLTVGDTYNAEEIITLTPSNASRVFLFDSSDDSVATVDEDTGLITAVGAGTATIEAIAGYGDGDDTLSVTVNAPTTPTTWDKVTSTSNITDGDYLIVYGDGSKAFNGGLTTLDATNNTISVSITSNSIAYNSATAAAKFTINSVSGGYSIKSASGYYIGRDSNSNGMDTSTSSAYVNEISISSGDATITGSGGKVLCFNTASDQQRFRYTSSGGTIQLYKASSGSGTPVPTVSGVTVTPNTLSLDLYNNTNSTLTATVNGTNSPAQTVTWSSSNTSKATVNSSGKVTALATGTVTITATSTVDTSKSGSCTVTITDSTPKTLSSIAVSGQTTTFTVDDTFSFGGTVTATYSDSSTANVTSSCTFTGYDMSTTGNQTVTVSYTYGGVTKTTTYQITVYASGAQSGIFDQTFDYDDKGTTWSLTNCTDSSSFWLCPASGTYSVAVLPGIFEGKDITSSVVITINCATYGSGNNPSASTFSFYADADSAGSGTSVVSSTQGGSLPNSSTYTNVVYTISQTNASSNFVDDLAIRIVKPGKQIRLKSIEVTFDYIMATPKIIQSLTASYSGGSVYVGDALDTSKVSVTASFTDPVKYADKVLTASEYELSGFSSNTAGNKTVTVTYIGSIQTASTPMTTTFNVSVINDSVTNVAVTNTKTYHPGETIAKSDITVTLSWASGKASTTTTDFTFVNDGYQFTYDDAPSGGSTKAKQFSIVYSETTYNFNVNVSRVAPQTITDSTVTLASSQFNSSDLSHNSNTASNTSVTIGGVAFTVTTNAYVFTQNSVNYLSFGKTAGSIKNTNSFASDLSSITVVQKETGRQDGILTISKDGTNWVNYSASELASGGYRYFKYAYEGTSSASGAAAYSNIQSISYTLSSQDNVNNVANYIMYTDTENQCTTKLNVVITRLNSMSSSDKNTFWTSTDYVIVTARTRLLAWAAHEGKTLTYSSGSFVLSSNNYGLISGEINGIAIFTVVIALAGISIIPLTYFFIRKRKHQ